MKQYLRLNVKLDNWNKTIGKCRANRMYANAVKKKEMSLLKPEIDKLCPIKKYPIKMRFKWHIKNSQNDLDNKSIKSILDQMQKSGILENDNIKHITEIIHIAIKDLDEYIEMEVAEDGDKFD